MSVLWRWLAGMAAVALVILGATGFVAADPTEGNVATTPVEWFANFDRPGAEISA